MSVIKIPNVVVASQGTRSVARRLDSVYAYFSGYISGGSPSVFVGDTSGADVVPMPVSPIISDAVPASDIVIYDAGFVRKNEMY